MKVHVLTQPAATRCPYCRDQLGELKRSCPGCATSYHPDCADELGGCATLGCGADLAGAPPAREPFDALYDCALCRQSLAGERLSCACGLSVHGRCAREEGCVCGEPYPRPRGRFRRDPYAGANDVTKLLLILLGVFAIMVTLAYVFTTFSIREIEAANSWLGPGLLLGAVVSVALFVPFHKES